MCDTLLKLAGFFLIFLAVLRLYEWGHMLAERDELRALRQELQVKPAERAPRETRQPAGASRR